MTAKKPEQLDLSIIKPCKKADIPDVHKDGLITSLPQYQELRKIAQYVAENGTSPYEAFDIIDFAEVKKRMPQAAKMKTLVGSFLMAARRALKEYGVDKKLELRGRKERIFLVSVE